MIDYSYGLLAMLALASLSWCLSVVYRNVNSVDSAWSLMILLGANVYAANLPELDTRALLILALVMFWALRLSLYLTWRNWGEPEDHRYRAIREKYQPYFTIKSLFVIFLFQAVLAWIVSLPLWPALSVDLAISGWDIAAIVLCTGGLFIESIADWQLARFKSSPTNRDKVLKHGLWRYSRHPNYFGECLIWWGFYLFAVSTGAWWSIVSPLLMTWLLLKFSGVVMLERTIAQRRPEYDDYIKRTSAFIPWQIRKPETTKQHLGEQSS